VIIALSAKSHLDLTISILPNTSHDGDTVTSYTESMVFEDVQTDQHLTIPAQKSLKSKQHPTQI